MSSKSDSGPVAERNNDKQSAKSGLDAGGKPSPDETQRALDEGDRKKIDETLDDLNVSTTESGKDRTSKPDTEGSNSSSKNLDEQKD
ncbi:hypothetical protein [Caballeronia sp. LZ035]|uniref:hypothetical protein n=1 Tax=Caballeronia sp. LZ035 TaxID=3038568 RepID=UPI002863601B|nr:hypothetical protein [Caballeronia sp. LZ035]MDR5763207.1 hypothetical protein [Caballeronia sp. LZ035]